MIHFAAVLLGEPRCTDCDGWGIQAMLPSFRTFFRSAGCVIGLYAVLLFSWRAEDRRLTTMLPPLMGAVLGCFIAFSTALSDEAFSQVIEAFYVVATISIAVGLALVVSLIANRAFRFCKTSLHKDRV